MRRNRIGLAFWLVMACVMLSQSTMQFKYVCEGRDATATTYTYLKEPRIQESDYSIGLKSGSFNFLENGNMDIEEIIEYQYGNGTIISNSGLSHDLTVNFTGDRGISEFFGRGSFENNRWVSAWKKIRYEESPTMKVNGWNLVARPSNSIQVIASTKMNTTRNASFYILNYDAKIKNGVIETSDETGWSNRTGARKYDWEHQTRTVGDDIYIINELSDSWPITAAYGPNDEWLPCCFKGTIPAIDQLDYAWPSDVVKATLKADTLFPTKKLSSKQIVPTSLASASLVGAQFGAIYLKPSLRIGSITSHPERPVILPGPSGSLRIGTIATIPEGQVILSGSSAQSGESYYVKKNLKLGMLTSFPDVVQTTPSANDTANVSIVGPSILEPKSCSDNSCDSYECIYTYDDDTIGVTSSAVKSAQAPRRGERRQIDVYIYMNESPNVTTWPFYSGESEAAKLLRYNITVRNEGDVPLSDVEVIAEMPIGMMFSERNAFYGPDSGKLASPGRDPERFDIDAKNRLIWNIGDLQAEQRKTILFEAYIKKDLQNKEISVKVAGKDTLGALIRNSENKAIITKCDYMKDGQPCAGRYKTKVCKYECPAWINQSI